MGKLLRAAELNDIKAPTRCHALACYDHIEEIETWRAAAFTEKPRQPLNDPQSVWKAFRSINTLQSNTRRPLRDILQQFLINIHGVDVASGTSDIIPPLDEIDEHLLAICMHIHAMS